jgi:hypothetical protein
MLLGEDLIEILDLAGHFLRSLRNEYPHLSEVLALPLQRRAAFAIPHLCVELSFHTLSGRFMGHELRHATVPFSVLCLATGFGDDLVDAPQLAFSHRVQSACASVILGHYAYAGLAKQPNDESILVTDAICEMIHLLTKAACSEIDYESLGVFSMPTYLSIVRQKTTSYTIPAFSLGASLSACSPDHLLCLREIGRHVGTAFQLIDDLLDTSRDNCDNTSYPAFLVFNGESLDSQLEIIRHELEAALLLVRTLPTPHRLVQLIKSIQGVLSALGA